MTKVSEIDCRIIHTTPFGDEDITHLVDEFDICPATDGVNQTRVSAGWVMLPPTNITLCFHDGRVLSFSSLQIQITIFAE